MKEVGKTKHVCIIQKMTVKKFEKQYGKLQVLPYDLNRTILKNRAGNLLIKIMLEGWRGVVQIVRTKAYTKSGGWEYYITDGQHRIEAVRKSNVAINFEMREFENDNRNEKQMNVAFALEVVSYNNSSKTFGSNDYLLRGMALGLKAYNLMYKYTKENEIKLVSSDVKWVGMWDKTPTQREDEFKKLTMSFDDEYCERRFSVVFDVINIFRKESETDTLFRKDWHQRRALYNVMSELQPSNYHRLVEIIRLKNKSESFQFETKEHKLEKQLRQLMNLKPKKNK